jgi:Co/Zn/Cd efflux system component
MEHCCEDKAEALEALRERQGRTIRVVFAINALMFIVEAGAGVAARSTALLGDSLDMLGDALVYGATLFAFTRGASAKAKAAVIKGGVMLLLGGLVLVEAVSKIVGGTLPNGGTMGVIGAAALAANVTCLLFLFRHRADDINMTSAWICSRNDIIANGAVVLAALAVGAFDCRWPDVLVGVAIAGLFLVSAIGVLGEGLKTLRDAPEGCPCRIEHRRSPPATPR